MGSRPSLNAPIPSMRSGWTAERQWASIMIAIACSIGCPSPSWTARLTACTAVGELLGDLLGDPLGGVHQLAGGMDLVDHAEPVRLRGGDRVAGHQHLERLARRQQARQQGRRAAAGGQAEHRLGLPEGRVLGGDDEVGALGELGAAAVGDPVDGGEDRLAQLADACRGCGRSPGAGAASPPWSCSCVGAGRCRPRTPGRRRRSGSTTRTAVRTAIVSTTSVSSAPISVVMALSACGRFRVTTAIRPSDR